MPSLIFLVFALALPLTSQESRLVDTAPLREWLARQAEIRTLAADFTQTRRLRALRDPVSRPGRLWFQAPGAFRWELGDPAETIALRRDGTITLVSVRRRTYRRFDPAAAVAGARELPFLEFPLAADYAAFRERFTLLDLTATAERGEFSFLPRDPAAVRALREIRVVFDRRSGHLLSFEVTARDGSVLRNEFTNVRVNGPLPAGLFTFDAAGYTRDDQE